MRRGSQPISLAERKVNPRRTTNCGGFLDDLDGAMLPADEDDPVDNLIWVSFAENAQGAAGDAQEPSRDRLRSFPNLAHALSHYE
jgi:hypothetical protein